MQIFRDLELLGACSAISDTFSCHAIRNFSFFIQLHNYNTQVAYKKFVPTAHVGVFGLFSIWICMWTSNCKFRTV